MNQLEFTRFPPLDYAAQEALNALCTNISFLGPKMKRIMITSSQASEGKTFISMNIMRTLARYGKSVAFIDMDLRRSMIEKDYGMRYIQGDRNGVSHYLSDMCNLESIVYQTNIPNTLFVPSGHDVLHSAALLNTPHLEELIETLALNLDYVIVDAPPVGLIIDAAEIAKSCDCSLMVVRQNRVPRKELMDAKTQVERSGCPVVGAIMNGVTVKSFKYKKNYTKDYYRLSDPKDEPADAKAKKTASHKNKADS